MDKNFCHILLIEDNPMDVDLIRRAMLKADANLRMDVARDGENAIEFLKQLDESDASAPVFILLDLKLPKINGLEVLQAFKSHPRHKNLPIIILTSSNETNDIMQAYSLGANSYILKPIDYDQFASSIQLIYRYWCSLNIYPE